MHVIITEFWWWFSLLLFLHIHLIEALNTTDFGLPNTDSCAFYYNQTVYIFNQQDYSLSISFGNPSWDTTLPMIVRHNITLKSKTACSITRSGKIILLQQQLIQPSISLLQIINDITVSSSVNNNITYLGSQNAIDTFITSPNISNFASATFNDFVIIFGGEASNNILLQSTFILDTRYSTQYVWYELPIINSTTPPATSNSTLYSTSRWILHFRTEKLNNTSTTFIDCFDPYGFQWLGTIASFPYTSTNNSSIIQVVPIVSSAMTGSDSLLVFPATQQQQQQPNDETNITNTNNFWKLDISTWNSSIFNLTKLNNNNNSLSSLFSENNNNKLDVSLTEDEANQTPPPPVVVSINNKDMALFYGPQQLQFFNTTSLSFAPQPQWLQQQQQPQTTITSNEGGESMRTLPIVLGSVIGGVIFIALIILFSWCFCFKKRRKTHQQHKKLLRPNVNNNNKKPPPPLSRNINRPTALEETLSNNEEIKIFSASSQYTLSPIEPVSPIVLFPSSLQEQRINHAAAASSSPAAVAADDNALQQQDEGIVQPQQEAKKLFKSRFSEHFDYHSSFPTPSHDMTDKHILASSKPLPLVVENFASDDFVVASNEGQQESSITSKNNSSCV